MKRLTFVLFIALSLAAVAAASGQARHQSAQARAAKSEAPAQPSTYFPSRGDWQRRAPAEAGMDAAALQQATDFAVANENPATKDLALDLELTSGMREPLFKILAPTKPRGPANGLVIRKGYVVAEWGDTARSDMTFSVTKTFLSTIVGLAWQRGLIRDVADRVKDTCRNPSCSTRNTTRRLRDHLLRRGATGRSTLWEHPDWADRPEGKTPTGFSEPAPARAGHVLQVQ
jgi:hypothetical protein